MDLVATAGRRSAHLRAAALTLLAILGPAVLVGPAAAYPPAEPAGEMLVKAVPRGNGDPRLPIALDALLRHEPAVAAPVLASYLATAPPADPGRRPALLLAALAHLQIGEHAAFYAHAEALALGSDRLAALAQSLLVFDHLSRGEIELARAAIGANAEQTALALQNSGLEHAYRLAVALVRVASGDTQAGSAITAGTTADPELGEAARHLVAALAQAPEFAPAEAALADTLKSAEGALRAGQPEAAGPRFAAVAATAHGLAAGLDSELRARTLAGQPPAEVARLLKPVVDRSPESPRHALRSEEVATRVLGALLAELNLAGANRSAATRPTPLLTPAEVLAAPAPLTAEESATIAAALETLAGAAGRLAAAERLAAERAERAQALADFHRRLDATRMKEAAELAATRGELDQAFAHAEAARQRLGQAVAEATARAEAHVDSLTERTRVLTAAARGLLVLYPAPESGARPEPPPLAIDRRAAEADARNLAALDSASVRARAALPRLVLARVRGERWPAVERQLALADSLADAVARLSTAFASDPELAAAITRAEVALLPPDPAAGLAQARDLATRAADSVQSAVLTADRTACDRARARLHLLAEASRFGYAETLFQIAHREGPVAPASVTADGPPSLAELALREAAAAYEQFVASEPIGPGAAAAWIRVGELRQELSDIDFRRALVRYEADRERGLATGPVPLRDTAGPAAAARTLLERFPNHPRADRALYNLGVLARDDGDLAQSTAYFTRLRAEHPESQLAPEAALRIGDNHFAADDYASAEAAYALIATEQDALGSAALYKLGWCRVNREDPAGAADAFGALLERDVDPEVRADASKTLARCLADQGGPAAAERFFAVRPNAAYAPASFHLLSQELANRSDYAGAVAAARMGAARHPDAPELADLLGDEINAYDRAAKPSEAAHARLGYARAVGPGSRWFAAHGSDSLAAVAGTTMLAGADQLMALAQGGEAGADSTGAAAAKQAAVAERPAPGPAYTAAREAYREYLTRFPQGAARDRAELMAAECEMNLGHPRAAADSYSHVAATTPDTARARIAAYGAVVAWAEARGKADGGTPELDGELAAIDHFVRYFSNDPRVPEALLRRGAIANAAGRCDAALASYEMLVTLHPVSPHRIRARRAQGDIALKCNRPAEAAASYSTLLSEARGDLTPADSALVAEAKGLLPVASFQAAEALAEAGKPGPAAAAYAGVAERFPDFGSADLALLRAGDAARQAGDRQAAAAHYGTLIARYEKSANRPPAFLRRAELAAEAGDSTAATREYLRFAADYPAMPEAEAALTTARGMARARGDWELVDEAARAELGWRGSATGTATLPARLDLVESLIGRQRANEAKTELDRMFPPGSATAETALSARAHLLRAELAAPAYDQVVIAPPLAQSIEQKKTALTALLADLDPAARYGEPADALAARDLLGDALADFGQSLVEAETPPDLEGEDLMTYSQGIATQADAFHLRAEAAWRDGLAQAKASELADPRAEQVKSKLFRRYDQRYAELTRARLPDPPPATAPVLAVKSAPEPARASVAD